MSLKPLFFASFLSFCTIFSTNFSSLVAIPAMPEYITIYVHGTTTALGLRLLSKFCKDVDFGKPGIHHINELPSESLLRQDALILEQGDHTRFDAAHSYTFGWSGKLSFKAREKAGRQLYEGLCDLLLKYHKKYGFFPKVRILTFSHGGNVALNMVKSLPFFEQDPVYLELVLVACPVQKVTESLIEHDCIDQSYVISSTRDILQVVDWYYHEKKRYVPSRFFETDKQNCRQVQVYINDRGLGHIDLMRSFMVHLPYVLNFADSCCSVQSRDLIALFQGSQPSACYDNQSDQSSILNCSIQDPDFRFYNLFNLPKVVRGQRKKHRRNSSKSSTRSA